MLILTKIVTDRDGLAVVTDIAFDPTRVTHIERNLRYPDRTGIQLDMGERLLGVTSVESFETILAKINAALTDA